MRNSVEILEDFFWGPFRKIFKIFRENMLQLNGCKNLSISSANSFRDDRFVFCRSPGMRCFRQVCLKGS